MSVSRPLTPPSPPLSDGEIVLDVWRDDDAPVLAAILGADAELAYWLDHLPQPYTEADARAYVARTRAGWRGEAPATSFAVRDGDGAVLGWLGVDWEQAPRSVAEVGYWLRREARGRGVATRAVRLAARWILAELGFERLELRVDARNTPSCRVAERAGFARDGLLRSVGVNARDGSRVDEVVYSLLHGELDPS